MDVGLKSNLTCPICLDFYKDPVALYCMHSFCRECLINNFNSRVPSNTTDTGRIQMPCPNCKKDFPLSRNGIRSMQRNFQLDSIVETFKKTQPQGASSLTESPACDMCNDTEGRPATKRCTKCEVSYCSECLEVCHPSNLRPFTNHTIVNIGAGGATGGAKPGGPPIPLPRRKSSGPIKAELRKDLTDLDQEAGSVKKFIEDLKQVKSTIERTTTDLKNDITNESRKLRDFVSKTENEHRAAVLDESKEKMMMVEIQLREHQQYLRQQEDVTDSLRALLKEPDEELFLRNSNTVKQRVQSIKHNKPQSGSLPSDTGLTNSTRKLKLFKHQAQEMMHGGSDGTAKIVTSPCSPTRSVPPSQPLLNSGMCVCQPDSIAICISPPVYVGDVPETCKVDGYAYKYKQPSDIEWNEAVVSIAQIESKGCIKIGSLTPSSQYNFSIRSHNSGGWSPWSAIILTKTIDEIKPQPLPQPQGVPSGRGAPRIDLSKTDVGAEIIILKWLPSPSMTSDAHIIAYCTADTGIEDWMYVVTQNPELSFVVSGLTPGSAYLFMVSACSKDGFSDWSRKVRIKLGEQKVPDQQESRFGLDKQTAHPCLVITGKTIVHPSNACPSISDDFTDTCYSVFGNAIFSSGAHYWEVIIHGQGSKVRIGVAEPSVNMTKPLGTCPDAWVLIMDARPPSDRQGSFVMYGNHMHKSGGNWIPFTRHIGVLLDYNQREICFIEYDGPPTPTTKRTSHSFQFHPPDKLKPVFAIDEKTDDLKLQVVTDKKPPVIPTA